MHYRDTETGEVYTEEQIKAEFERLKASDPETYNYSFTQYLRNCTSKNGFLEEYSMMVCEHCLYGIESHEGSMWKKVCYVDEFDEEASRCEWCEESGFTELYAIRY